MKKIVSMSSIETKQLFLILQVNSINDLKKLNECRYYEFLVHEQKVFEIKKSTPIFQSIYDAISMTGSPIDIFWALTSIISLGVAALPLSFLFLAGAVCVGSYYFYSSYNTILTNREEWNAYFQLASIKLNVCDEIISRYASQGYYLEDHNTGNTSFAVNVKSATNISKSRSIAVSVGTTSILFASYYLGVGSVLGSLGFLAISGAMMGPIGLAVAGAVAISVGIFLGYQHYQSRKNIQMIKAAKASTKNRLKSLIAKCNHLKSIEETVQIINVQVSSNQSAFFRNSQSEFEIVHSDRCTDGGSLAQLSS